MLKYKIIPLFILSIANLANSQAFGEYRVYQYYVRSKIENVSPVLAELVTSTLNPIAYVAYHGGKQSVEVNLLRSWQCMGNTSKEPICPISDGRELSGAQE